MSPLNESMVEDAALGWFGDLGYSVAHTGRALRRVNRWRSGSRLARWWLAGSLREAVRRLNPRILEEAWEETLRKACRMRRAGSGEQAGSNY